MSRVTDVSRNSTLRLGILFGTIYFVQGIGEPTEGLISQPMRSLLDKWGFDSDRISLFVFWLGTPWWIKPLYGLLIDFVPLRGSHRRTYLILSSLLTAVGLGMLVLFPVPDGSYWLLLAWLMLPAVGLALGDVVTDALMIETGQPLGLTGRFQSIQWAALYGASILTGWLGGVLTKHGRQQDGLTICGIAACVNLLMAIFFVREPRGARPVHDEYQTEESRSRRFAAAWRQLVSVALDRRVQLVGLFLVLWSFNPFSSTILQLHMVKGLEFGEEFYGNSQSVYSCGSVIASVCYGLYCRRVPFRGLIHASIVSGVLSTLGYWWLDTERTALVTSFVTGFFYMTGTLIQLDLAARICPLNVAGTVFALLMSACNISASISTAVGGWLDVRLRDDWHCSRITAFNVLVGIGAGFSALCWLVVPALRRQVPDVESGDVAADSW